MRVKDGAFDFARVAVAVSRSSADRVTAHLTADPDGYHALPEWVAAAEDGARSAADKLADLGVISGHWCVRINRIDGSIADTRPQAVRCASGIATWAALAPRLPQPFLESGRRLRLRFPTLTAALATSTA